MGKIIVFVFLSGTALAGSSSISGVVAHSAGPRCTGSKCVQNSVSVASVNSPVCTITGQACLYDSNVSCFSGNVKSIQSPEFNDNKASGTKSAD